MLKKQITDFEQKLKSQAKIQSSVSESEIATYTD
jgi:hypothetical protein